MASRIYTVVGKNMTVANAQPTTFVFVNPGTGASLRILRCWVSQYGTAVSQQLGVQLSTQVTAFPTLTGATPGQMSGSDGVSKIVSGTTGAAGTCGINASAEGAGAKTVLYADAFNNLNGWIWIPTPDEQITLPASAAAGLGIVILTAPTTLSGWNAGITFAEV